MQQKGSFSSGCVFGARAMCENVRVSVKRGFQRKLLREKEQMER
jgi:hypothetical protein